MITPSSGGREVADEIRFHGVGFAVKSTLLSSITRPSGGNERILTISLQTLSWKVNMISAYAPTLDGDPDVKDRF